MKTIFLLKLVLSINVLFWLFSGVANIFYGFIFLDSIYNLYGVVGGLSMVNGIVFIILFWLLEKKKLRFIYMALGYVHINLLLTLLDDFGLVDGVVLVVNVVTIILLFIYRNEIIRFHNVKSELPE